MALVLGAQPARAYVLLGLDWSYKASPMGEDFNVCTTSFPVGAVTRTKDGAAAWDYAGFNFTFGADSCLSGGAYPTLNNVNQFDYGSGLGSGVLAQTTYWYSGGNMTECDIRMNSSYAWYAGAGSPPAGQWDWQSVAAHEFGHCMGFGHSSLRNAVMYASIGSGVAKRTPTADDINGRTAMYGAGPGCGNGIVEGAEECDDGNSIQTDGCTGACVACGNSVVTPPEGCDDGNLVDGDGCSAACRTECAPSPDLLCEAAFGVGKLLLKDIPGKEQMRVQFGKGPALAPLGFGNPLPTGGSSYALCLYDQANSLVADYLVARAGDSCNGKPCWKSVGSEPGFPNHRGYSYKDAAGTSDGINKIVLNGPGAASIKISGRNNSTRGLTALPTGIATALAGSTRATAQFNVTDTGSCFSLDLDVVRIADGTTFQAQN